MEDVETLIRAISRQGGKKTKILSGALLLTSARLFYSQARADGLSDQAATTLAGAEVATFWSPIAPSDIYELLKDESFLIESRILGDRQSISESGFPTITLRPYYWNVPDPPADWTGENAQYHYDDLLNWWGIDNESLGGIINLK